MRISVFVPVYKEPKFLGDIVKKLETMDYKELEIFAVVDGIMTAEIDKALTDLRGRLTVVFPNLHLGKAEALNRAARAVATDVLLFLDNDILLPDDDRFLRLVAEKMQRFDIVDMPKEVVAESFFSAMIGHEYQSLALSSLLFSLLAGRSPGIIGSAFAVRKSLFDQLGGFKKVVHEDGDFGARAFRVHARYSYDLRLKVKTSMPNDLKTWATQRKRWTLINVLWFKENFLFLLKSALTQPSLFPTLGAIVLPSLLSFLAFFLLKHFNLTFLNPMIFMLEQPLQFSAGVFLWLAHHSLLSQGLFGTAIGFLCAISVYLVFSLFGKFRFNVFTFIVFYFFYTPLLILINLAMFIAHFKTESIRLDWKV